MPVCVSTSVLLQPAAVWGRDTGKAGLGRASGAKQELGFWVRGGNSSWSETCHLVSFQDTVHLPQPNMLR